MLLSTKSFKRTAEEGSSASALFEAERGMQRVAPVGGFERDFELLAFCSPSVNS